VCSAGAEVPVPNPINPGGEVLASHNTASLFFISLWQDIFDAFLDGFDYLHKGDNCACLFCLLT
jgi:hypothetical protein